MLTTCVQEASSILQSAVCFLQANFRIINITVRARDVTEEA